MLFAKPPAYDPARPDFDDYFDLQFLVMERTATGCAPVMAGGAPLTLSPQEAIPAIFAVAGANTNYVLHPEELLADNFAQLMLGRAQPPSPEVQARLAAWLGAGVT